MALLTGLAVQSVPKLLTAGLPRDTPTAHHLDAAAADGASQRTSDCVRRDARWFVAADVVGAAFVAVLGPGRRIGGR